METLTLNDGPLGKGEVTVESLSVGQRPDRVQVACRMPLEVLGTIGATGCWLVYARALVEGLIGVAADTYDFESLALTDPGFPAVTEVLPYGMGSWRAER